MSKVIGVITARMASTRLPGKVMKKISGKTMFELIVERMKKVEGLNAVCLATSDHPKNEVLIKEAKRLGCGWYAGAEQDVVARHIVLCQQEEADAVIRVTCDCPIFDINSASSFVKAFKKKWYDYIYVSNMTMVQGTLSELISYNALCNTHQFYRGPAITSYIKEHIHLFKTLGIEIDSDLCRPEYRSVVDEAVDLKVIREIYQALYKGEPLDLHEVYAWLDDNPYIAEINRHVTMKGVNKRSAEFTERPVYSIVESGKGYVILDAEKRMVKPLDFLRRLRKLFTEL